MPVLECDPARINVNPPTVRTPQRERQTIFAERRIARYQEQENLVFKRLIPRRQLAATAGAGYDKCRD